MPFPKKSADRLSYEQAVVSSALASYDREREVLDRALGSPKGIRLDFDTRDDAVSFRMRCYGLRRVDRRNNCLLYPQSDPSWGRSAYDVLILKVVGRNCECGPRDLCKHKRTLEVLNTLEGVGAIKGIEEIV